MRKFIKIKSIHSSGSNYGEYLYTPPCYALEWIKNNSKRYKVEIIGCQQPYKNELIVKLKGKRIDLKQLLIAFICNCGEHFNLES